LHVEQPRNRRGRRAYQQRFPKQLKSLSESLGVDFNRSAVVADPASELVEVGEAIDKRTKANALHAATDTPALCCGGQRGSRGR
jgi:hypothetical protein